METEAELRAEVACLREDVDHLLEMLGESGYQSVSPRRKRLWLEPDSLQIRANEEDGLGIDICGSQGRCGLYFYDAKGRERGSFIVSDDGVLLELHNAEGKVVLSLGQPDERGQIYVSDEAGVPRATMKSTTLGGVVGTLQPNGQQGAYLLTQQDGGKIEIVSANVKSAVSMYADEDGCGVIRVHESSGEMMASLAAKNETGLLVVCGPLGEMAGTLAAEPEGGVLLLSDPHGNTRYCIPPPVAE